MAKASDILDASLLSYTQDVCSRIDSSLLSRRINRLNPCFLTEARPATQSAKVRAAKPSKSKIIPELRALVDLIKNRLKSTTELKMVSRPCTRMRLNNHEALSPGKYHRFTVSTGGNEFSKSPRLQDYIEHQISSKS